MYLRRVSPGSFPQRRYQNRSMADLHQHGGAENYNQGGAEYQRAASRARRVWMRRHHRSRMANHKRCTGAILSAIKRKTSKVGEGPRGGEATVERDSTIPGTESRLKEAMRYGRGRIKLTTQPAQSPNLSISTVLYQRSGILRVPRNPNM